MQGRWAGAEHEQRTHRIRGWIQDGGGEKMKSQYLQMLDHIELIENQEKACGSWPHDIPLDVRNALLAAYDAAEILKPVIDFT